jgi:uncharacterized protein YjbI with pentapeptide repeats
MGKVAEALRFGPESILDQTLLSGSQLTVAKLIGADLKSTDL